MNNDYNENLEIKKILLRLEDKIDKLADEVKEIKEKEKQEGNEKSRDEWSKEVLAWQGVEGDEEGIDIEGNRSDWREFSF